MFVKEITSDRVIIDTPAKVNLFLEVLNKRPDNFHNINSLFQAVSLFDNLDISINSSSQATINLLNDNKLTVGSDNLIARAYELIRDKYHLTRGILVNLTKNIPVAAGLAGGSSDAAATILACNILFNLDLDFSEMAEMSLEIGSDIPFFFSSGQALVSGRGEMIEDVTLPTDYGMVLVKPDLSVSTAEAYASLKMDLTYSKNPFNLARRENVTDRVWYLNFPGNDFEPVLFRSFSVLGRIKEDLMKYGALKVQMTGSGPTIFGIFNDAPDFDKWDMPDSGDWQLFWVRPVTLPGMVVDT